ncbi:MAG: YidC/Oxa1 family membrane protein insertase [Solirubrobacteraceae bacterium]
MLLTANIFQPLIDVFEAVLKFFHNSVGVSWGFSIVVLTIVIRALLIPLTLKQFHSMQRMQRLQPELKAIQGKYKEDKQRQQQEMMKFYRENNVNPLGSCLPLVAQLPVFVSLYYMLRTSLRHDICPGKNPLHAVKTVPCGPHSHAGFLFISDLTNSAKGATLVVLIILYVGTQLGSSLMMASATVDKTQRQIAIFMPLIFVFIILGFPAGVIVYWITTNAWTMIQQYIVRRRIGPMGPPVAAPGAGGLAAAAGSRGSGNGSPDGDGLGAASGGIGALIRNRLKPAAEPAAAAAGGRSRAGAAPPPPPRKKKKRSGRRR